MNENKHVSMEKRKYIIIFLFLTVLCFLFPWGGDDWAWGSSYGMELFKNGFRDYNGRYLGNLLVLALTRSHILRALIMAITLTELVYVLSELAGEIKGRTAIISTLLFLMPAEMFAQAVAWTSGFCNYVPPVVIALMYIQITKEVFDGKTPTFSHGLPMITLALGFAGSLFIEHGTIYNICLALFVLVYAFIRFKRVYATHVAFLAGSILGALVMFSNGAYRAISQGRDWYRSMAHDPTDILNRVCKNAMDTIIPYAFKGSFMLILFLCVTACVVGWMFHGQISKKWVQWHEMAKLTIVAYTAIVIIESVSDLTYSSLWSLFEMSVTILYVLAWVTFLLSLPIAGSTRAKMILYLLSAVVLDGCLLIVRPIGPRCLFGSYVFFCLLAVSLLNLASKAGKLPMREIRDTFAIGAVVIACFFLYIYGSAALFDHTRLEKIRKDIADGNMTVYVDEMINGDYVYGGNVGNYELGEQRFKQFYGIDEDVNIVLSIDQ